MLFFARRGFFIGNGRRSGFFVHVPFDTQLQMILLPQSGDLRHQLALVMRIQCSLIPPAVNEQHGFGIVHGQEVGVALAALLLTDSLCQAGFGHLPGEGAGAAVAAGVVEMDGKTHEGSSLYQINGKSPGGTSPGLNHYALQ